MMIKFENIYTFDNRVDIFLPQSRVSNKLKLTLTMFINRVDKSSSGKFHVINMSFCVHTVRNNLT